MLIHNVINMNTLYILCGRNANTLYFNVGEMLILYLLNMNTLYILCWAKC